MDLRLTSNAAASPKGCNPNGLCRFGRLALLLLGNRALRLCSLVAPRQPAKASTARTTPTYEMGSRILPLCVLSYRDKESNPWPLTLSA